MRIATYNVEWFDNLFDVDDRLRDDGGWSGRYDVRREDQIAALVQVFAALDADAVMVIEAPDASRHRSTVRALETFARVAGIRARQAAIGFANDTQQEIALLYDPDTIRSVRHDPRGTPTSPNSGVAVMPEGPRFDGTFRLDIDVDAAPEMIAFSKPPFEVALETAAGNPLRLIGVHIKSKAPHGATSPEEAVRLSIANRRKQLAQCIWLRKRVDEHLDAGDALIVMGDFNDGPGLDEYEKLFGRSGVEIVLGWQESAARQLLDPHAREALAQRSGTRPASARFYLHDQKRYLNALLDFVMVSPDLAARGGKWRIWHPFDDPACWGDQALCKALLTASDHFPVTLDIDI